MYSQLAPELFGFFLANIPLAVAMLDRHMCYLFTSCQWLNDYGLENQSIIGRSHNEVFPKISSKWQDIQQRCLLGSVEQCEKDCWTRANGKTIWVKWRVQPWRDENHEIGGLILSTEVLTPTQPRIEINYPTVETTSVARQKEKFCDYQSECNDESEITQQHWAEEAALATMTIALQKLHPEISQIKQSKTKQQQYQEHLEALVTKRTSELAQVNEQLQAQIDERKQVEGTLRKQLAAIEAAMDGIAVLNQEGEYLYLNKAHVQLFGYSSASELLGKTWQEIYYPDEIQRIENEIFPSLMQNGHWQGEAIAKKLDGSTFAEEVSLTLIEGEGLICVCRDITTRKQAEDALQQSETRFQKLAANVPGMIYQYRLRPDGSSFFSYVSPGSSSLLERNPEEIQQDVALAFDQIHPDFLQEFADSILVSAQTLQAWNHEYQIITPSGCHKWVKGISRPEKQANGDMLWDGLLIDISDRKVTEQALAKSEALYRAIVDDQTELICRFLPDGTLTFVNDVYCRYFNKSRQELLGTNFVPPIPDEDLPIVEQQFASLSQENPVVKYEHRVILSPGEVRWQQWTQRVMFDSQGNFLECQAVGRDITERKLAEEALRRSESDFRRLAQREAILNALANQIRNSLDLKTIQQTLVNEIRELLQLDRCCITWYDPHLNPPTWHVVTEAKAATLPSHVGCYPATDLSPLAQKLLQLEIIRADSVEMISDSVLRQSLQSMGYSAILALPTQTEAGEVFIVSCIQCGTPRRWAEDEVELLQAVINNLAIAINHAELYEKTRVKAQELEQALYELQRTQTQLVQSEKMSSLGQLMAGVAHEINNPVSFIYGNVDYASDYIKDFFQFLELYRTTYPDSTPEIQNLAEEIDLDFLIEDLPKLLDSMKIGATRIREIVRSLGIFSRIDQAEYKLIDLHEGLDNTLLILEHRLKATATHPRIDIIKEYGNLPLVECYGGQINQVFMNLLTNAIDAMNEAFKQQVASYTEKPCTMPTIIITTQVVDSNQVSITIADNGSGILNEVLPRLFDPFFTTKPVGKGTGLGLAISYQIIVEKHGGSLRCNSLPGCGTEFVIELPIKQL